MRSPRSLRDSLHAVQFACQPYRRGAVRHGRMHTEMLPVGADALFECLTAVEHDVAFGEYALAAEAVQRFQWEALKARAQGMISRDSALGLIDEAQLLCEDLWACEFNLLDEKPTAGE